MPLATGAAGVYECGMALKVVSDVDIPTNMKRHPPVIWPHQGMVVGESFWISCEERTYGTVLNANTRYGKRYGFKFVARRENGGVRVWRVA